LRQDKHSRDARSTLGLSQVEEDSGPHVIPLPLRSRHDRRDKEERLARALARQRSYANARAQEAPARADHWIAFQLIDSDGNPVAGAECLCSGQGVNLSGHSDEQGILRWEGLNDGEYQLCLPEPLWVNEDRRSEQTVRGSADTQHRVQLRQPSCWILELADFHFHFGSAVYIPRDVAGDNKGLNDTDFSNRTLRARLSEHHPDFAEAWYEKPPTLSADKDNTGALPPSAPLAGLSRLSAILSYLQTAEGLRVVIAGHTDTVGSSSFNKKLSGERAQNILSILEGDSESWLQVVRQRSKVIDYQAILVSFANTFAWPCHPGAVDDADGPQTQRGLKGFQRSYNELFAGQLAVDGIIGPQSWRAIFDIYQESLANTLGGKDELAQQRACLERALLGEKTIACGESFPIESMGRDNYRSAKDRRVEIIFFRAQDAPGEAELVREIYEEQLHRRSHVEASTRHHSIDQVAKEQDRRDFHCTECEEDPSVQPDTEDLSVELSDEEDVWHQGSVGTNDSRGEAKGGCDDLDFGRVPKIFERGA
jgi:hypothetical protein